MVCGGLEFHFGSTIVKHGKTFDSPTSPIEINLELPSDFIVGATGKGGYVTNQIILVQRNLRGDLSSYVCGSDFGGTYTDADVPVVPPPPYGPCILRFTQGACGGSDCSGGLIHGVRFFWQCDP